MVVTIAVEGAARLSLALSLRELCLLFGPLRSLELFLLLSLAGLALALLLAQLRGSSLILHFRGASLFSAGLLGTRLVGARLFRAGLLSATRVTPSLLGNRGSPVVPALALLILR